MIPQRIGGGAAAVTGALVLLAPVVPAHADTPPDSTPEWGECSGLEEVRGTYCATLDVPLDHGDPDGDTIELTLSIAGAGDAPRTLVVNPGGPGAPGIGTARQVWTSLPQEVAQEYNVVSFDPRGAGSSTPVPCGDTDSLAERPAPPYTPSSPQDEEERLTVARQVAEQCAEHGSELLPHMTTENAARDMDLIRQELGRAELDFLGYSYGTRLGATYATLFPSNTGRMVFDSVKDPEDSSFTAQFKQNDALQHRAEQFFAWAAEHDDTYGLGDTGERVAETWEATRQELEESPAGERAGSADLDDMLASAMYTDLNWPGLARAVAGHRDGDSGRLLSAADQLTEQGVNTPLLSYTCVDDPWPRDWETWREETRASAEDAPLFAWLNTWYSAPCAFWDAPASDPVEIGSEEVPPVLMLHAKDDPATPLAGAEHMRETLPGSRLVVADSGNHGQFLFDVNDCVDDHGARFLLTGELPERDTTCPGSPAPTP
ncbi:MULTISPECIES: alpha/beta hydrolase [unclassified Streptomyces]|uniref:alpha/beta hydrolase n=1 Tax=unclassified Streptomyces TaxID=2593676 RepID=UPI000CD581A3|nr:MULTISPECIES: alpha/beta hydrolase [unclassified Streptomyces]